MQVILNWLRGKKTYIAALGLVIASLTQLIDGQINVWQALEGIFEGLGLGFLRAGVSKINGTSTPTKI